MDADKLEEAFERFYIMDEQSDISREYIYSFLNGTYGAEITNFIKDTYSNDTMSYSPEKIASMKQIDTKVLNNAGDAEELHNRNILSVKGDILTLSKYINAGIKLIPTKPNEQGNFFQLKKNKGTDQETIIKIDTVQELKYWISHDINRFIFIPKDAGFLCIDIDRNHSDGVDGMKNFYSWLKNNGLDNIPMFKNLDGGSFPTYTTTASGGIHLYFRCNAELKTLASIAPGVEIKYNGLNITAGGSVKNDKLYSLHGDLNKAPLLPVPLLLRFSRELSKEPEKQTYKDFKNLAKKKNSYTIDQLLDFGRMNATGGNHDKIFNMATRLKRAGYQEADTIEIIKQTPEYIGRNDKNDTITCIKSIYR